MNSSLLIVAVQAQPLAFAGSLEAFSNDVSEVVSRHPGVQLVVYPELHLFHARYAGPAKGPNQEELAAVALESDFVKGLSEIASRHSIWLIPGSINEKAADGQVYNTALVFNPSGELVAHYRKMFPWRPFEPHTPGTSFVIFAVEGVGRIGLNTCYDMWFPETCRNLTWLGADLIINLVKTTTPDRAQEILLVRANAIANQVEVISINSAGPVGFGCSLIVGPEGEILTEAMHADRSELRYTFDPARVAHVRQHGTMGLNRMWEQFRPGDQPINLPLYGGSIDPSRWAPVHRPPHH